MDVNALYELLLEKIKNSNESDHSEEMIEYIEHELMIRSRLRRNGKRKKIIPDKVK